MPRLPRPSVDEFAEGIALGNRLLLSRAITLAESTLSADRADSLQLLDTIRPNTGRANRIAVTGAPGAGKSTFLEAFGQELIKRGETIALLTIDPSGLRRPGSILGDKTRMEILSRMPEAYIRPSPSGGAQGGIGTATAEAILLCEAAGFSTVIVETVGVGQNEVPVHNLTDLFMLLTLPGAGDEVQGIKRGIMEMADIVVITKADGDNLTRANIALSDCRNALHLMPPTGWGWAPPVLLSSAYTGSGIADVADSVEMFFKTALESGHLPAKRSAQQAEAFRKLLSQLLTERLYSPADKADLLAAIEQDVLAGKAGVRAAAEKALDILFS
ncbi:MAG: methylmalonyl Co-A mutase-associated GTPase MeaB [Bacteroidota bacterium]